uniref:tRNA (carboxymethyluridine(34)-5-O)-methyltransferase n=1 Tax=Physcomitrium patens TaxID=3218 RepID=A0A7I4EC52_PHYPA
MGIWNMDIMLQTSFVKPPPTMQGTAHLYVANCGPDVGLAFSDIKKAFEIFGSVENVQLAGASGSRVYVSYHNVDDAVAARNAWNLKPCDALQGRVMVIQHAVPQTQSSVEEQVVFTSSADVGVPGLTLYTDFVTLSEEQELLREVDERSWQTLAKRRVQHYGYEFLYKTRNVDLSQKLGELPASLEPLLNKISLVPEIASAEEPTLPFDQLTVNEYPRGVGLSPHIDTHSAFEGSILSLSLGGPCIMEFRKYIKRGNSLVDGDAHTSTSISQQNDESNENAEAIVVRNDDSVPTGSVYIIRKALFLPPRSLLILSGEARYAWHHYIPHHKIDNVNGQVLDRGTRRVSFTFRKVRPGACNCPFIEHCDSQVSDAGELALQNEEIKESTKTLEELRSNDEIPKTPSEKQSMSAEMGNEPKHFNTTIPEIEKRYVHKVYNAIAPHFSDTRFAKWPKVAMFLESMEPGSVVADAGCGNGKYLGFNKKCFFVGCDISPPLIGICAQHGHEALVADALHLPYRTGFFDAGISIAVLHHLSNEERRLRAMEELLRVVRRKGRVLFTVWAVEQEDKKLLTKWTPLTCKYTEEWVDDTGAAFKRNLSMNSLKSIQEVESQVPTAIPSEDLKDSSTEGVRLSSMEKAAAAQQYILNEDLSTHDGKMKGEQQEYFVPWHLPYHRAEIAGASAAAIADGLARKDDVKRALVYNRYYHCFVEGELESVQDSLTTSMISQIGA